MTKNATVEMEKLEKLAKEPGGLQLLESYRNNMRFKRDWNGICGNECLHISRYLEKLIDSMKKSVSISDFL